MILFLYLIYMEYLSLDVVKQHSGNNEPHILFKEIYNSLIFFSTTKYVLKLIMDKRRNLTINNSRRQSYTYIKETKWKIQVLNTFELISRIFILTLIQMIELNLKGKKGNHLLCKLQNTFECYLFCSYHRAVVLDTFAPVY